MRGCTALAAQKGWQPHRKGLAVKKIERSDGYDLWLPTMQSKKRGR